MSARTAPHPLRWLPPLLVGAAAATAAEVALGLLLYDGPGLMRSLTTVLVVESTALALGLWMIPGPGAAAVDSLRRRWLFCMVVFLGATLFAASWSLLQGLGGGGLGQGLGLAVMGALPLYATGAVLAGMSGVEREAAGTSADALGGPALLGAALGFLGTGWALPRLLTPASLFLTSLVLLSAGGLVYGRVLDRKLRVRIRDRRPSAAGDVRVEDRENPGSRARVRVLVEGDWIRRWQVEGEEDVPWDLAVWEAVLGPGRTATGAVDAPAGSDAPAGVDAPEARAPRVLLVGGGASLLPRTAVRAHPTVRVDVVERSLGVVELAREHLDTDLRPGTRDRIRVWVGNVEDLLGDLEEGYDLVLVDTTAFRTVGGVAALSRQGRSALFRSVGPGGVLALGPVAPDGEWIVPDGWRTLRLRRGPSAVSEVVREGPASTEEVMVASPGELPGSLEALGEAVGPAAEGP